MQRINKISYYLLAVFFTSFIILGYNSALAQKSEAENKMMKIAHQLVCLCGCGNQILATCTCGNARGKREFILTQVEIGKTEQEILDIMVANEGEQVLAAPKKKV